MKFNWSTVTGDARSGDWREETSKQGQRRAAEYAARLKHLQNAYVVAQVQNSRMAWKHDVFRGATDLLALQIALPVGTLNGLYGLIGHNLHPNAQRLHAAMEAVYYTRFTYPTRLSSLDRITRSYTVNKAAAGDVSWATLAGLTKPARSSADAARGVRDRYRTAERTLTAQSLVRMDAATGAPILLQEDGSGLDWVAPSRYRLSLPATFWANGWHAVLDGRELYSLQALAYLTGAFTDATMETSGNSADVALPHVVREGRRTWVDPASGEQMPATALVATDGVWRGMRLRMDNSRYQALTMLQEYGLVQQTKSARAPARNNPSDKGEAARWAISRGGFNADALDVVRYTLDRVVHGGYKPRGVHVVYHA